jgi:chromosomal replication initiation ATPase DnaA
VSAREPARQLVLDIAPEPRYEEENFLVSKSNEAAHAAIGLWPDWPDRGLVLVGPPGAGKSHLGAIWAQRAGAAIIPSAAFAGADVPALAAGGHVLLDDADRLAGEEKRLFHLMNLLAETRGSLLLTARGLPNLWGFQLPDLLSRLRRALVAEIFSPDDDLLRAVLVKLLVDRQLTIEISVIDYVLTRLEPTLDAVRRLVDSLDREALSRGRRITKPIAADVLAALQAGEEQEP